MPDPALQRVTPEELQAALGALEGRVSRPLPAAGIAPDAAHVPDTLSIGEAADALGLSIPADELWREVQEQRAEKEKAQEQAAREQAERGQTRQPPPFQQVPPLHSLPATPPTYSQSRLLKRIVMTLTALAVSGWLFVGHGAHHVPSLSGATVTGTLSAGGEVTLSGDATVAHYVCTGGTLTVNGDADTVTLDGHLDRLIINGDADTVRAHGSIKAVTLNGDANTFRYPSASAPIITGDGSANSARAE